MNLTEVLPFIVISIVVTTGVVALVALTLFIIVIRAVVSSLILQPVHAMTIHWKSWSLKGKST